MSDTEEGRNEDAPVSMRERILAILGSEYGKKIDAIAFDMDRIKDSKPAVLIDYEISFEKLERFAPPGLFIVEIAGKKIIVNLGLLDRRMPWGPDSQSKQNKPPIFVDVSPGLSSPRLLNAHDLPHNDGPDTIGNSNLFYMTDEICDMMRDIRNLIADGARVIEKRKQWSNVWFPETIYGCLLGCPVVFWSDSGDEAMCLPRGAKIWEVEWIDGEAKRAVFSFCVPFPLMNHGLKAYLQRWTDSIHDRNLPHQNFYMLQSLSSFSGITL